MNHTPKPWTFDPKTRQIVIANGRIVAYVSGPFNNKGETVGSDIIRAVNAHADLVAALQAIDEDDRLTTNKAWQIARDALAKARGEPT